MYLTFNERRSVLTIFFLTLTRIFAGQTKIINELHIRIIGEQYNNITKRVLALSAITWHSKSNLTVTVVPPKGHMPSSCYDSVVML